jgi:hypothetical protein
VWVIKNNVFIIKMIKPLSFNSMAPLSLVKARWKRSLWVQNPPDACITYQSKKESKDNGIELLGKAN